MANWIKLTRDSQEAICVPSQLEEMLGLGWSEVTEDQQAEPEQSPQAVEKPRRGRKPKNKEAG